MLIANAIVWAIIGLPLAFYGQDKKSHILGIVFLLFSLADFAAYYA